MRTVKILLVMFIFFSQYSYSQQKTLNISVGEWPPYITEDLKHKGVVSHIIKDIFMDIGYNVEFSFYPWPRAYSIAAANKVDLTGIWMHKQEREKDFYYSEQILSEEFVFFHLKNFNFDWKSIKDLKDLSVIGMLGYSYGPEMDEAIESDIINMSTRVSRTKQAFGMLLLNRVQLYPQEINIGYYILNQYFDKDETKKIINHPTPYLTNYSYLLFPKTSEKSILLLKQFNQQLSIYKRTGKYDKYFKSLAEGYYYH